MGRGERREKGQWDGERGEKRGSGTGREEGGAVGRKERREIILREDLANLQAHPGFPEVDSRGGDAGDASVLPLVQHVPAIGWLLRLQLHQTHLAVLGPIQQLLTILPWEVERVERGGEGRGWEERGGEGSWRREEGRGEEGG